MDLLSKSVGQILKKIVCLSWLIVFYIWYMPRSKSLDSDTFDPKINWTLRILRKQRGAENLQMVNQENIEDKVVLRDYAMPLIDRAISSIWRPFI